MAKKSGLIYTIINHDEVVITDVVTRMTKVVPLDDVIDDVIDYEYIDLGSAYSVV